MNYIISKITDLNGVVKTSKDAKSRVNRIVKIFFDEIKINNPMFMECFYPGYDKSIITSRVKSYRIGSNDLTITTENSVYYLQKFDVNSFIKK